jgi:hypothetical protein
MGSLRRRDLRASRLPRLRRDRRDKAAQARNPQRKRATEQQSATEQAPKYPHEVPPGDKARRLKQS